MLSQSKHISHSREHVSNDIEENYRRAGGGGWNDVTLALNFKTQLRKLKLGDAYIVSPNNLVGGGIRFDYAFKVAVVPLFDVVRIQARAQLKRDRRWICGKREKITD